jgi:hypothetical protein
MLNRRVAMLFLLWLWLQTGETMGFHIAGEEEEEVGRKKEVQF